MKRLVLLLVLRLLAFAVECPAQTRDLAAGPDPREFPVPEINTPLGAMPGVAELPVRKELPEVLVMNDGSRVTTPEQWRRRREEMKRILQYYAIGAMPPPPGNVKGQELAAQTLLDGTVKYRLIRLTFGPDDKLELNIGIFTPASGGPFPAVIMPGGTPPGAAPLPLLPPGPGQGKGVDVLLPEAMSSATATNVSRSGFGTNDNAAGSPSNGGVARSAVRIAEAHRELFRRGYVFVVFNHTDCAEDTTLRNPDGSWAFRTTRFYPAYPNYDWGILAGWAWGVSRIVDYLETDAAVDHARLIVTGASRTGKSAMIAAAFDERLAMAAPVVTGGGGIGAYRFSGTDRVGPDGKEGLSLMEKKYPNWFSPHLHEFWGQADRLPFDEHWFLALVAPRPFIALEGRSDGVSLENAVKQSWLAARQVYAFLGAEERLGVNYADHAHAFTTDDWNALLDFADKHLLGKTVERRFDQFPPALGETLDVRNFGATGDGTNKDTTAFQKAIDVCAAAAGGIVAVPAGDYLVGSLALKSGVTLRLEKDTHLLGSPDLADYPVIKVRWEGRWVDGHRGLISADGAHDIGLVGPGKISANPALGGRAMPRRPVIFESINCTNVHLEGFATEHQRMWSIHPTYCENVSASNLVIRSTGGNGDGIDVDSCRHVRIESCDIATGDDCIAIKSGRGMEGYRAARPTEDVLISHCTLSDSLFACIGIGSESSGGIRGVRIEHCRFTHARSNAIYIKSRPGRGAFIKDITGADLDVETAPNGFLRVNLLNSGIQDPEPVPGLDGVVDAGNFRFTDVRVHCGTLVEAAAIPPEKPLDGFSLVNISGQCTKGIVLANITNALLQDVTVTGCADPLLTQTNVQGTGLGTAK